MALTLYYNPISQPSRSILTFLHLNDIKYEKKPIDIFKGEQKSSEYTSINPVGAGRINIDIDTLVNSS